MEKMSWWGNIESCLYLKAIIFLHQPALLKDIWKAQFCRFRETKKDDPIIVATIFLETLSIYIHLKMETEEFVAWFSLMF